ncbi:MAG: hypothetical protein WAX28_14560 [Corynebacterium variabile]|uniref:hypothetical protein n=1 Tax=Corynebacterium variabile TaxID=1727 RepID=UPI003BB6080E
MTAPAAQAIRGAYIATPDDYPADHPLAPILRDTPWGRSITQAAINAAVSPEGLLFRALQMILSHLGPQVVLPPIGGAGTAFGSINMLTLLVGPSGAGKSSLAAAAEGVIRLQPIYDRHGDNAPWPTEFEPENISGLASGQALGAAVQTLVTEVKNRETGSTEQEVEQPCDRVSVTIDEGNAFLATSSASGSILKETITTAVTGGSLSTKRAARSESRNAPALSYTAQVAIFIQDALVAPFFEMDGLGLTQRLLFASAQPDLDLDAPVVPVTPVTVEVPVYWMQKLDRTEAPERGFGSREHEGMRCTIKVADEVAAEVRRNRLAAGRRDSEGSSLDTHQDLLRLKVAVPLALLTGQFSITPDVWELAGHIIAYSRAERARLMAQSEGMATAAAAEQEARRLDARAAAEETLEERRTARQKPRVLELVQAGGENGVSSADLTTALHGALSGRKRSDGSTARADAMAALSKLVEEGAVIAQGHRYYDAAHAPAPLLSFAEAQRKRDAAWEATLDASDFI